jgi:hypothetical protein
MKKKPAKKATKSRIPKKTKNGFPLDDTTINLITSETNPEDTQQPSIQPLLLSSVETNTPNTKQPLKESLIQKRARKKAELEIEQEKGKIQRVTARKNAFIKAMVKNLGIVTKAVKTTGIPERTHFWWMEHDEVYRDKVNSIKEVVLDFYEDALHELVRQKHPAAIIFALKTQGRKRGYIETVHNINQSMSDDNLTFYLPDNKRDEDILLDEDAKIVQ